MYLPPTNVQKINNLWSALNKYCLSLMLTKITTMRVQRMKLSQRISARSLNLAKFLDQRCSLSAAVTIFKQKQFWILQILTNCQNILRKFYKEGYIQYKVGSHIITGVPQVISMCTVYLKAKVQYSGAFNSKYCIYVTFSMS